LMRWLVRFVTPPGGTVGDFFAGSGTTAEACVIEGFPCVLAEKDPVAAGLIMTRLRKPIQPDLFGGAALWGSARRIWRERITIGNVMTPRGGTKAASDRPPRGQRTTRRNNPREAEPNDRQHFTARVG
jgi:hypothetical protein